MLRAATPTGFIKDFEEDLAELPGRGGSVPGLGKAAAEAEEKLKQDLWEAQYTDLPAEDEEGL